MSYVNLGINVVLSRTDFWRKIYTIKFLLSYIRILAMGRFIYYVMVRGVGTGETGEACASPEIRGCLESNS